MFEGEKNNRKLSITENYCLRTIVGVFHINHIKMDNIKSDLGMLNKITDIIKKKKIEVVWSCAMQRQCQICQPFIQE